MVALACVRVASDVTVTGATGTVAISGAEATVWLAARLAGEALAEATCIGFG
ncbi:MAG: hypothetical protein ACJ8EL_05900 [Rhizomicrobium sp.]|jgi:hypothetical protein